MGLKKKLDCGLKKSAKKLYKNCKKKELGIKLENVQEIGNQKKARKRATHQARKGQKKG